MQNHVENYHDTSMIVIDENELLGLDKDVFQRMVLNSIEAGCKNISVDLSNVKIISSIGIEGFLHAYKTCTNNNVNFSLKNVSKMVLNELSILKLNKVFNII